MHEIVYQIVAALPKGKVTSYGQIAKLAGYPNHARIVGNILKNLPSDTLLPWHRVINSQGKISFPQNSDAYNRQRLLLEKEGVSFKNSKIISQYLAWQDD